MSEDETSKSKRKPAKNQVLLRLSDEVAEAIDEFIASMSPSTREKLDKATMRSDGKPHGYDTESASRTSFIVYAMREALRKGESKPREFGGKIDEFVENVMASNLEAYEQRPENWWELTAIGSSMLRDDGHNPTSVKRWLEENGDRIAEHHAAVGITDPQSHNRKAGKARKALAP